MDVIAQKCRNQCLRFTHAEGTKEIIFPDEKCEDSGILPALRSCRRMTLKSDSDSSKTAGCGKCNCAYHRPKRILPTEKGDIKEGGRFTDFTTEVIDQEEEA